ncbi:ALDH-like protein [Suhomyces tanzawaensis NRRL Y-17324]|uniref:ALDH-like protein n=1 Tax=Suhomyces tanzawaensis NRRL Y-17324 TaxID=984487 RepID=A0A1E4SDH3_9ASCO|nr:ALDH-like protein [Suhomyces tanzawaensis NRRL Y-17324]ODV77569.1 ALDH-like protein [Suhomyces tanzawaensis NRRL Y-17324]
MSPPSISSKKSASSGSSQSTKREPSPASTQPAEAAKAAPAKPTETPAAKPQAIATSTGPLIHTKIEEIAPGVDRLVEAFHSKQKSHSLQYRLNQLRNLYFAIKDNVEPICDALYKDFYRVPSETRNFEVNVSLNELVHTMAHLHKWAKPDPVTDTGISQSTSNVYVEKIPLGVVLIISPFNYPLFLTVGAMVGAIAAGNAVVLKLSESTPHFSQLFTEIVSKALDPEIFYAVNGAIPETTALLEQKFDKIMYTGNGVVGRIVAKKAAETLTPVTLELGGKSPAFVLEDVKDSDIPTIARRIAWALFMNAGQTCVAVDYVVVHASRHDKLVKEIVRIIKEDFFPSLTKDEPQFTHIIHDRAYANLVKIIESSKGNILVGGKGDASKRFIPPTVIDNVDWSDSTMRQEIFGPVLPIISYTDLGSTLITIQKKFDTPLAQYVFTSKSTSRHSNPQLDQILTAIRSGGLMINDAVMQSALSNAPFGGVGESGQGSYHGLYSYKNFTHERTTIEQKLWNDFSLKSRYPPYNSKKDNLIGIASVDYNNKVWFGRTGNVNVGGPSSLFTFWTSLAGISALVYYVAQGV